MSFAPTRRAFLAALAAAPLWPRSLADRAQAGTRSLGRIGVQLYTVRDLMAKDFDGTLEKIAALGYQEVEFAGYFDRSPQAVRATLERCKLTSPAAHVDYATLTDKWPQTLESAKTIGHRYLVNPWIEESIRNQPGAWSRIAQTFNRAGQAARRAGIQFAYHNHHFEFVPVDGKRDGKRPYDILLAECDKELVKMELDLCWIAVAGADPLEYFTQQPGRFPMVHVKDMKRLPPKPAPGAAALPFDRLFPDMTEVGSGVIDWKRIFVASATAGIEHYFVEHDQPADPLASIGVSYRYLRGIRF
jgi:sugar phosphate isomerase/epimerase